MSVAPHTTFLAQPPTGDQEPWAPLPLGWRLLITDHLLWLALGLSLIIHLLLLAPHYAVRTPQGGEQTLTVSFRDSPKTTSSATTGSTSKQSVQQDTTARSAKPLRADTMPTTERSSATTTLSGIPNPVALMARDAIAQPDNTMSSMGSGRRVTLTPGMKDYRYSQYLDDWRRKVERIGAMNYPEEARGRFFGSLVLSVALRPDGNVDRILVVRSSGNKVLDDAAKRIVMMSAPFAPFPASIRQETDYLDITRTWNFTRGDALETR